MPVLFDDELHFHYGFAWFDTGVGTDTELVSTRGGQANGILGAAEPGLLSMVIGMHTGQVPVRVEVFAGEPEVEDGWDDIVEASVDARGPEVTLSAFSDARSMTLPANGWYRARWYDDGADAGRDDERYDSSDPVVERCQLHLWPAPPQPDVVVRETTASAAYWREQAARTDPPASVEVRAHEEWRRLRESAERDRRHHEDSEREWRLAQWGGREPSPRLIEVEHAARSLTREHRDLVDALVELEPAAQRELALELTRRVCGEADGRAVDWAPALSALEAGRPLPPPFDDRSTLRAALFPDARTVSMVVRHGGPPPPRQPLHPASAAAVAVPAAALADPLAAVLDVVNAVSWSAPYLDVYFADLARRVADLS